MKDNTLILVNSKVLPPVFCGVLSAKTMLEDGRASNTTQAIKMAGISRSAYYKYRDYVFEYHRGKNKTVNISSVLSDKAGVLSAMTNELSKLGANIITINQSAPTKGFAAVTLTVDIGKVLIGKEGLTEALSSVDGVSSVKII